MTIVITALGLAAVAALCAMFYMAGQYDAEQRLAPKLTVVCAWCHTHVSGPRVSHGICAECKAKQIKMI